MASKFITADEIAEKFITLLETVTSTDTLREQGISERAVQGIERAMRAQSLDPRRPEDVREMIERIIEHAHDNLKPRPN
jgi:hypothetical protein